MASITLNNIENPSNMVVFTDIPNILKISQPITGTKAVFYFDFEGNLRSQVTADTQYYITFLGETISNVMSPSNAKNKRFYISGDEDGTALSVARAFRNCPSIAAEFNILHTGPTVTLYAKTIGQKWSNISNYLQRNIPSDYLTAHGVDGSANSVFFNGKIDVNIFSANAYSNEAYVTTLEKNFYGDECAFDVSPVLATISEFGKTTPFLFGIDLIREDGEWQSVGLVGGYTSVGYLANQTNKYLFATGVQPLTSNLRGESRNITLYTYSNVIPYSVLCGLDTGGWNVTASVKDSAMNEIYNSGLIQRRRTTSNMLIDDEITIPQQYFDEGYYVDINIGANDTIRFDIIKPLKATEYYQRILWRNQYGGISFFDFTGTRSETDDVDIETYEKNVFDYYETNEFEKKKIYKNDYKKSVKLTTHLMKEDGKWAFNSLMRSKRVWTVVNGKTFYIIPKSVEVNEDQTYNNIYTATLTYEYSDIA